jgi:hypothetical protein
MTRLEQYEQQHGVGPYTTADWHAARRKSVADRSDLDLAIIEHFTEHFGPRDAAAARAARAAAVAAPLVTKGHVANAPVAEPVSDDALIDAIETAKVDAARLTAAQVALIVKGAPDLAPWARDKYRQARERAEAENAATLGLDWQQYKGLSKSEKQGAIVGAAIKQAMAKRIDTLEARVLELEATQAARSELVP